MENTQNSLKSPIAVEATKGRLIGVNILDSESGRKGTYCLEHTRHSQVRSKQRGINNIMIALTIEFGDFYQKQGLDYYVFRNKATPQGIHPNIFDKARNTVVIIGDSDQIVTCYKGSRASKHIQRKSKYLSPKQPLY